MPLLVKICGLSTEESVECALQAGADMLGFVFHPKSPRHVTPERAAELAIRARNKAGIVALVADADDVLLAAIQASLRPDMWQMHGAEPVERISQVRKRFNLPVMKALGWSGAPSDRDAVLHYAPHAAMLLLDAKPPEDAAYPGGHGKPFDWTSLAAIASAPGPVSGRVDFMLSGGLTPDNAGNAIRVTRDMRAGLIGVDVSSGVESAPGIKDPGRIRAFVAAVRKAEEI